MAEEVFSLSTAAWQTRQRSKGTGRWDLSESEYLTLDLLVRHETMTVGQLQRQIGVLPAQMSRIVRALEGKFEHPLIQCTINPQDKRKVDVTLAEAGRSAHRSFRDARLEQTMTIFSQMPDEDIADFMRVVRKMRKILRALNQPAE